MIIDGLYDYFNHLLEVLVIAITYPFIKLFSEINIILSTVVSIIVNLFESFYNLLSEIIQFITVFLQILPSAWSNLLIMGITIYSLLRLYNIVWGGQEG